MTYVAIPKGEIVVDDKGRVRGFNRIRACRYLRYRAEEDRATGVITLTPVQSLKADELLMLKARGDRLRPCCPR